MSPSLVVRPAFLAALASPFFLRMVVACWKSPLASASAALALDNFRRHDISSGAAQWTARYRTSMISARQREIALSPSVSSVPGRVVVTLPPFGSPGDGVIYIHKTRVSRARCYAPEK